jgi:hypothetical protein
VFLEPAHARGGLARVDLLPVRLRLHARQPCCSFFQAWKPPATDSALG